MPDTLAQMVRAKYPGAYDDLSDTQLEAMVRAKFPGVYDDVPSTKTQTDAAKGGPPTDAKPLGIGDVLGAIRPGLENIAGIPQGTFSAQNLGDVAAGVGKSVLGTIAGGGQLLRKYVPGMDALPSAQIPVNLQPTNTAQRVGKTAGDVAQFFAPAAALSKLKAAAATGQGLLDALFSAGAEATSAGTIGAAQSGDVKGGIVPALTAGGTTLATQGVLSALPSLARKTETVLTQPSAADKADGFSPDTILKNNLGGTLSQTYDKVQTAFKNLSSQLKTALTKNPAATIDLQATLADARNAIGKQPQNFAANPYLDKAFQTLSDMVAQSSPSGASDLLDANVIKQQVGKMGAWTHATTGAADKAANDAMEVASNAFYDALKNRIENASGQSAVVKTINQKIGELIPVERAVIRRLPVVERQRVIGLGDVVGLATGSPWLSALDRFFRSGPASQGLYNLGTNAATIAPAAGRVAAGVAGGGQ